ncbi:MAG TPA: Do family serine endopeptidase [Deltaproteobacteria bacterium]|nr:Do family serine endopeptidase [Deltaproteobacteria bacterium]
MRKNTVYVLAVVLVLLLTLGACTNEKEKGVQEQGKQDAVVSVPKAGIIQTAETTSKPPITSERDFRNIIVEVAGRNIPAVVHIEVTQSQEVTNPFSSFENDPFFRRFFDVPQGSRKFKRELKGIGTGMIMNSDGYILTNNHVVGGATQLQVILSDGKQYGAKIVGTDPKTDLAVIKVSADEKLPSVTFGDSDRVEVGEWVVAIGHPRGLDQTVTQGIISAKHRKGITDPNNYQDFLQTDAAINPGNSGGPLLNLDGQVIGVNSVIASQSGGSEGLGFAIPSNMAVHIAKSLIETGKVQRGWLGVSIQDIQFPKMKALKLDTPKGAYVADVMKGGPAAKAGIKTDDVILSVDGKEVEDSSTLRNLIAGIPVGTEVKIGIVRDGKKLTIPVKVGNLDDATKIMASALRDRLGIDVRPLSEKELNKYGLDPDQGVAINWINPKGSLGMEGFEVDDVILGVNGQQIGGVDDLVNLAQTMQAGQKITLFALDHRTGRTGNIQVEVR